MIFGFLDAVANEFIRNEWDRRGMYMAIYIYVQCSMGPGANVHSAARKSS
jgi:hypothetical protein